LPPGSPHGAKAESFVDLAAIIEPNLVASTVAYYHGEQSGVKVADG
jgi:hypothetical protein